MLDPAMGARVAANDGPRAFATAQAAWFWTMGCLEARKAGAGAAFGSGRQVCEPDDVVKALDRLYRQRRVDLAHARVMRVWGERGIAPNPSIPGEKADARLWKQAMAQLSVALEARGIVQRRAA